MAEITITYNTNDTDDTSNPEQILIDNLRLAVKSYIYIKYMNMSNYIGQPKINLEDLIELLTKETLLAITTEDYTK